MNIYTLIHLDHEKAKRAMREIKALPDNQHEERLRLFYPLMEDLIVHNDTEQQTFYVALKQHAKTARDIKYAEREHQETASLLEKLDDEDLEPAKWRTTFDELCKDLMHHISKEEGRVFSEAHDILSEEMAVKLAEEMGRLKKLKMPLIRKEHQEQHTGRVWH